MRYKIIFLILSFIFCGANEMVVKGQNVYGGLTEIPLDGNDDDWDNPKDGTASGSRTLPLPFSASVMNNQSVVVNFYEAIGEVAITISTVDGQVLYQALENIISPQGLSISIPLTSEETLLLEFSNSKGAYASGVFTLSE